MKKLLWLLPIILVLSAWWAGTAFAQDPTPSDNEVNRIAKQLFCPVCESTPLDVCPTEACRQWRELIRTMLAEGKSEAEVRRVLCEAKAIRSGATPIHSTITPEAGTDVSQRPESSPVVAAVKKLTTKE